MRRALQIAMGIGLAFAFIPKVSAQCLPATCSLTLTIQTDPSGIGLAGSGTNSATMSFGAAQAFGGGVPSGVSKVVDATSWTLTTPFDVNVACFNLVKLLPCTLLLSSSYTLTAQLQISDTNDTWKIQGLTLNNASASTLTSNGTYDQVSAYSFALTIPFSEPAGIISNNINFVAISN